MPVQLGTRLGDARHREARIEIVPLIDIMFFLLASFMLVSLGMTRAAAVRVDLPSAAQGQADRSGEPVVIAVDAQGVAYWDGRPVGLHELAGCIARRKAGAGDLRVIIDGDRRAGHGAVVEVIDVIRAAGVTKVGFGTQSSPQP